MQQSHTGRVALVTGAARGLGREMAIQLARRGAQLVLVDLEKAIETNEELGGTALVLSGDVSSLAAWQGFAQEVKAHFGRCDIVVNNAGIFPYAPIEDVSEEMWDKTLRINLYAHFYAAKAFVPLMKEQGWGRFVNISSNSIGTPKTGLSHYMASKMGVIGFVRGLANDLGNSGITVNAVLPPLTRTPGTKDLSEAEQREVWQQQAIKRFAEPSDVAGTVLFLTSDDASFMTGQTLVPDGGMYKIS